MKLDEKIYKILLEKHVDILISGPSIAFNNLINLIEEKQQLIHVPVIREDEAIGIASGLFIGGKRTIIIINEMGLGNLINAITNLSNPYRIPLILMISPSLNFIQEDSLTRKMNFNLIDHFNFKKWTVNGIKDIGNINVALDYSNNEKETVAIIFENLLEGMM